MNYELAMKTLYRKEKFSFDAVGAAPVFHFGVVEFDKLLLFVSKLCCQFPTDTGTFPLIQYVLIYKQCVSKSLFHVRHTEQMFSSIKDHKQHLAGTCAVAALFLGLLK